MSFGHCEVYIIKIGNPLALQICEVDGSSSEVQENLRSRSQPLIEMQVECDAD